MSQSHSATYGATDDARQQLVVNVAVADNARSPPPLVADDDLGSLRQRMEIMLAFAILRRKYLTHMMFYGYFVAMTAQTPFFVYLFQTCTPFVAFFLNNAGRLHTIIQSSNLLVFFALLISGFNLELLFSFMRIGSLFGNFCIAVCCGLLFALESVDQVAVHYKLGWIDESSVFHPYNSPYAPKHTPYQDGLSPDSAIFICVFFVSIISMFMVIVNLFHFLYYQNVYTKLQAGNMNSLQDEDGDVHV